MMCDTGCYVGDYYGGLVNLMMRGVVDVDGADGWEYGGGGCMVRLGGRLDAGCN